MQVRKELRQQIKERLLGHTQAGDKVNVNHRTFEDPYPFIEVSTPEDESFLASNSIRSTSHTLTLYVDIVAESQTNVADQLDDLAEEVERLIDKDELFNNLLSSLVLVKTQIETSQEGEKNIGFLRLEYHATYMKQKTPNVSPNLPMLNNIRVTT